MMRLLSIFLLTTAVLSFAGTEAFAGKDRELTYRESQVWTSAVRFLRVEQNFKIQEKDKAAGYILFEYKDMGKTFQASMEIVPTIRVKRKVVLVRIRIQSMPSYVSSVLLDRFERKLKEEYGTPPPAELVLPKPVENTNSSEGSKSTTDKKSPDSEDEIAVSEEDLENEEQE